MANWTDGHLFGLILVGLAVFVFLVLLMTRWRVLRFRARAIPGTAKVFSSIHFSGEGGSGYRTEVYFVDESGSTVETKLALTYPTSRGQEIDILYDPNSPKKVMQPLAQGLSVGHRLEKGLLSLGCLGWSFVLGFLVSGLILMLVGFGDPICADPTFRDMDFCLNDRR